MISNPDMVSPRMQGRAAKVFFFCDQPPFGGFANRLAFFVLPFLRFLLQQHKIEAFLCCLEKT